MSLTHVYDVPNFKNLQLPFKYDCLFEKKTVLTNMNCQLKLFFSEILKNVYCVAFEY